MLINCETNCKENSRTTLVACGDGSRHIGLGNRLIAAPSEFAPSLSACLCVLNLVNTQYPVSIEDRGLVYLLCTESDGQVINSGRRGLGSDCVLP